MRALALLFIAALCSVVSVPSVAAGQSRMAVSIHAQSDRPAPGKTIRLALRMTPKPGWHGYWSNPGDSGLPPKVRWTKPTGVTIGALRHPSPKLLQVAGLTSYVHDGAHTLLMPMTLDRGLPIGTPLRIAGKVDLLVCSDSLCVPEKAEVALDLVVGDGAKSSENAALFREAQRAFPASSAKGGTYQRRGNDTVLTVPNSLGLSGATASFFPFGNAVFRRISATRSGTGDLQIAGTLQPASSAAPRGIVGDGKRAFQLRWVEATSASLPEPESDVAAETPKAQPAGPEPNAAATVAEPALDDQVPAPPTGLVIAIFGALIGGLLLNLMPCVFPVLSLKAMHLARAGGSERAARREGLAYTAGAVAAATALGAIILALREGGVTVGWSFQLQHPAAVLGLLILVTGIALNLAGLFHVTPPSLNLSTARPTATGAFGTGALAAIIATPCSAPFMAGALGAALLLPGWSGLLIFGALGLGLALPFLALGWFPAMRDRLPRPGAWMERLQRILSLPMFATAVGLAWVLGRQTGSDAMALGLAATVGVGLALWWGGARQRAGKGSPWLPATAAATLAFGALSILAIVAPASDAARATAVATANVQPFSEKRLASLRADGTPVFVDFTADWCLTCKVNEKVAIDRAETQAAFRRAGVVTLVGDWTRGDPQITRFLARHQRNSIPFYLYYPAGKPGEVLPQILTTTLLREKAASD